MVYTVTFNPALDCVAFVPEFKTGVINKAESEFYSAGGKGINVSRMLTTLGIKNTALGFTAGFIGKYIESEVENSDFIHLKNGCSRINIKISSESETEINSRGPDIDQNALSKLIEKLKAARKGDYIVLAGSIPPSLSDNTYKNILSEIANNGAKIAVDTTGKLLTGVLEYHPFIIKPNHHELGEIFKCKCDDDNEIIDCAKQLQNMGARNVIVSRAKKGAILLDDNGVIHKVTAPNGKVLNSVGAGDSMLAGFIANYIKTNDYEKALRFAVSCGSATAFSIGLASKEFIESML